MKLQVNIVGQDHMDEKRLTKLRRAVSDYAQSNGPQSSMLFGTVTFWTTGDIELRGRLLHRRAAEYLQEHLRIANEMEDEK